MINVNATLKTSQIEYTSSSSTSTCLDLIPQFVRRVGLLLLTTLAVCSCTYLIAVRLRIRRRKVRFRNARVVHDVRTHLLNRVHVLQFIHVLPLHVPNPLVIVLAVVHQHLHEGADNEGHFGCLKSRSLLENAHVHRHREGRNAIPAGQRSLTVCSFFVGTR